MEAPRQRFPPWWWCRRWCGVPPAVPGGGGVPGPLRLARLPLAASGSGKISLRGRKHRGAAAASVYCRVALHFPLVPPVSACLSVCRGGNACRRRGTRGKPKFMSADRAPYFCPLRRGIILLNYDCLLITGVNFVE